MSEHFDPDSNIRIYSTSAQSPMRKAGRLACSVLDYISEFVGTGISTGELDELMHNYITSNGAIPAPLNYRGYPKSTCISINHVVCHGIPDYRRKLKATDCLNIDVTVIKDGWYGDTSRMFFADFSRASIKAKRLVSVTEQCLALGIEQVKVNNTFGHIGWAIQSFAEKNGFSVVRDFVGHGIGRGFHEAPNVLHYGNRGEGHVLKAGMIFTIEPMINAGAAATKVLRDGWTAVSRDKSLSAQAEHTLMVTASGVEVFTAK